MERLSSSRLAPFALAGLLAIVFALVAPTHGARVGVVLGTAVVFAFAWAAGIVIAQALALVGLRRGGYRAAATSRLVGGALVALWIAMLASVALR